MLGMIWALAILGVIMKATRGTSRHPRLGLALYLGMGWSALIVIRPLISVVPRIALFWLATGGIAYTIGVLFFVNKRRYAHFIWHLFVLAGTSCHFLAVLACTS
jgi:hemolysin III